MKKYDKKTRTITFEEFILETLTIFADRSILEV